MIKKSCLFLTLLALSAMATSMVAAGEVSERARLRFSTGITSIFEVREVEAGAFKLTIAANSHWSVLVEGHSTSATPPGGSTCAVVIPDDSAAGEFPVTTAETVLITGAPAAPRDIPISFVSDCDHDTIAFTLVPTRPDGRRYGPSTWKSRVVQLAMDASRVAAGL